MDIHDYFQIQRYLKEQQELVRETILQDILLNPENYAPWVKELSGLPTINVRPEYDEDDTPFIVEVVGSLWSEIINVPSGVINAVQMPWGKEREIEECANLFETRAVGKIYGMLHRREILTKEEQDMFHLTTPLGRRIFTDMSIDGVEVEPQGVRFRMGSFLLDPRNEDFVFYVSPDLLTAPNDLTSWRYWDEIFG